MLRCDPCPQKFYQRYYNRCTKCHPCSECGPNEQIKQPCTDETDTDCESIIPPDPVPTTPPKPTSTPPSPASAQTSTNTPGTTTDVPSAATQSTSALTYMNADTTQVPVLSTTQAEKIVPTGIATSKGTLHEHCSVSLLVFQMIMNHIIKPFKGCDWSTACHLILIIRIVRKHFSLRTGHFSMVIFITRSNEYIFFASN